MNQILNNNKNLQELWQDVEYRNFPIVALNYIISDTSICADARMCWIGLFSIAYFDNSWTVQISKSEIASLINRSKGSVGRYLADLEKSNYIKIKNVKSNGVWLPSKITVIVPGALHQQLENCPTRKKGTENKLKLVVNNATQDSNKLHVKHKSYEDKRANIEHDNCYDQNKGGMIRSDHSKSNINKYNNNNRDIATSSKEKNKSTVVNLSSNKSQRHKTIQSSDRPKKISNKTTDKKPETKITVKQDMSFNENRFNDNQTKIKHLESELEPLYKKHSEIIKLKDEIGAIKMLHKLTEFKKQNKHMFEKELEINKLKLENEQMVLSQMQDKFDSELISKEELKKQKIRTLTAKLNMLETERSNANFDNMRKIDAIIFGIRIEIQKLEEIGRKPKINNRYDYLNGTGQREFSDDLKNWLQEKIDKTLETSDEELIFNIANEVAYQVRFGNLQVSYKTGQAMTVKHGCNIALKLLRENEWSRPTGMLRAA